MRRTARRILSLAILLGPILTFAAGKADHVVLVVWDGMRPDFITPEHTPTLHRLARAGVLFQNHHSVFCTATIVNGTAMATGACPEHSGVIANNDYRPELEPLRPIGIDNVAHVRKGDRLSGGRYLLRPTMAEILQRAGKRTVIASAKEVGLLHDRRERANDFREGLTVFEGKALPPSLAASITNLLGVFPPSVSTRSALPNEPRDLWTTRALLDALWSNGVPALSVLWLSEPDYSQHAAGPGSPKALAALASSDRKLAAVLAQLEARNRRDKTDVFVVSDHGFSTVETVVDVAKVLRDGGFNAQRGFREKPNKGDVLVVSQGGSVLFYVMNRQTKTVRKLVEFLQQQDFTGVLFTRKRMPGTFTLDTAMMESPDPPDVVLSMRWSTNASRIGVPGLFASDGRRPGEGSHASLSRFDVHNILVGAGPDLKQGFESSLPSGNTDLAPTILWVLGVKPKKAMDGRVLSEALTIEAPEVGKPTTRRLEATRVFENATWSQYLRISRVNDTVYLDEGNGAVERQK